MVTDHLSFMGIRALFLVLQLLIEVQRRDVVSKDKRAAKTENDK
jgi:hypothetical protein